MVRRVPQVRLAAALLLALPLLADAETVMVKYSGPVDLSPLACAWTPRSSFIVRLCHDPKRRYVVVNLAGTYYHYCAMPGAVVQSWLAADSMGRFYNAHIKGRFACR